MYRTLLLSIVVAGLSLLAPFPRPVLAAPPGSIDEYSVAEGLVWCAGEEKMTDEGIPFPHELDGTELPSDFGADGLLFCEHSFTRTIGGVEVAVTNQNALAGAGLMPVKNPEDQLVGWGPGVQVEGTAVRLPVSAPPGVRQLAQAFVTATYLFTIDIDVDALPDELLDEVNNPAFSVPVAVAANAQASINPMVAESGYSVDTHASITMSDIADAGPPEVFVLARLSTSNPDLNIPSDSFFDTVDIGVRRVFEIQLQAGGTALGSGRIDDPPFQFSAQADPVWQINAEALRAQLLEVGIDHPAPEQFFQLRVSPDVEYALATVPEPSSLVLAVAGLAGLAFYGWRRKR